MNHIHIYYDNKTTVIPLQTPVTVLHTDGTDDIKYYIPRIVYRLLYVTQTRYKTPQLATRNALLSILPSSTFNGKFSFSVSIGGYYVKTIVLQNKTKLYTRGTLNYNNVIYVPHNLNQIMKRKNSHSLPLDYREFVAFVRLNVLYDGTFKPLFDYLSTTPGIIALVEMPEQTLDHVTLRHWLDAISKNISSVYIVTTSSIN